MIYTSYYANVPKLLEAGIEPIAVSRGVPKGFPYRKLQALAPTWAMLKMSNSDYDREYEKILARANPHFVAKWLGNGDVALLCWEKNPNDCHRSKIAEWLRKNGYEVREFGEPPSLT